MLQKIEIKNYAIIKNISIDFAEKLNTLTGETGAGKSIIIDAFNMLLGERIDWGLFDQQKEKCVIEAHFEFKKNNPIFNFLLKHELEQLGSQIIIRKEINPINKTSRNFLNDNLITTQNLKNAGKYLVDLHQQFDYAELYDTDFQFNILDSFAKQKEKVLAYQTQYLAYQKLEQNLNTLKQKQNQTNQNIDYLTFVIKELDEANLGIDEVEKIEGELKFFQQSFAIENALQQANKILAESDVPILQTLKQVILLLKPFKNFNEYESLYNRLNSVWIELNDVATEIEKMKDKLTYNEERLNFLTLRFDLGNKLLKKYQAKNSNELFEKHKNFQQEIKSIQQIDNEIIEEENRVKEQLKVCICIANELSEIRKINIPNFEKQVKDILFKMGMTNAILKIELQKTDLNIHGIDKIDFLLDANNTQIFKPLKKVASGGELNRLMLSIKSVVAALLELPTLVFDEIDTGVSGEVAKQIGEILYRLSNNIQIICITHQATIAAKGHKHIFIFKEKNNDHPLQTKSTILLDKEREIKIAEMLSGTPPTVNALNIARELLQ